MRPAHQLDEKVLAIRRRVLGNEDRATVLSMNNVAIGLRSSVIYQERESCSRKWWTGAGKIWAFRTRHHHSDRQSCRDVARARDYVGRESSRTGSLQRVV